MAIQPVELQLRQDGPAVLSWQTEARCATVDPEVFFPDRGGSTKIARAVCNGCPVKTECLVYALDNKESFGIWGGTSERQRRQLRKERVNQGFEPLRRGRLRLLPLLDLPETEEVEVAIEDLNAKPKIEEEEPMEPEQAMPEQPKLRGRAIAKLEIEQTARREGLVTSAMATEESGLTRSRVDALLRKLTPVKTIKGVKLYGANEVLTFLAESPKRRSRKPDLRVVGLEDKPAPVAAASSPLAPSAAVTAEPKAAPAAPEPTADAPPTASLAEKVIQELLEVAPAAIADPVAYAIQVTLWLAHSPTYLAQSGKVKAAIAQELSTEQLPC